jgi:chromosome segregation ATPase
MIRRLIKYGVLVAILSFTTFSVVSIYNDERKNIDTDKINKEIDSLKIKQNDMIEVAEKMIEDIVYTDSISKHKMDSLDRKVKTKGVSLIISKYELDSVENCLNELNKRYLELKQELNKKDVTINDYKNDLNKLNKKNKHLLQVINNLEIENQELKYELQVVLNILEKYKSNKAIEKDQDTTNNRKIKLFKK